MIKSLVKRLNGTPPGSISGSMRKLEILESLYATAVECYAAALDSMAEAAVDAPRGAREEFRKTLKHLRGMIRGASDRTAFEACRAQLDNEVKRYGRMVEEHALSQERDAREIVAMLASMAESVASREKQHHIRFKGIARKLRMLTSSGDLAEIRQRLAEEVEQLDKVVDDMARDTKLALTRVNSNLKARKECRRVQPWKEEAVDPVTQLAGRPEATALLATRLRRDLHFCVVLFSVEGYADLSAIHGSSTMDALLREFAGRLQTQLSEAILLCRWNEAEMLAIIEGGLPEVASRSLDMERRLSGAYSVHSSPGAAEERIVIHCVSSVLQPLRGETVQQLLERLRLGRRREPALLET